MNFRIDINMDNVAFHDGSEYSNELVRLLDCVKEYIEMGLTKGNLRDINGNQVGKWLIANSDLNDSED